MGKKEKKTILIIDDDEKILSTLDELLTKTGYKTISADNGMEGLKLLDSAKYDLVITDISMPFVSGVGVIAASKEKHPHIPVIAMTGFGKEPLEAAMEKKADVGINKPFEISVILGHIEKLLAVNVHS